MRLLAHDHADDRRRVAIDRPVTDDRFERRVGRGIAGTLDDVGRCDPAVEVEEATYPDETTAAVPAPVARPRDRHAGMSAITVFAVATMLSTVMWKNS